jgi:replicative DNA helicase
MRQEELVDRLLVGQADVDAWRLKTGKLSESDFTKLSEAMGVLADAPIFIDDTPGISIAQIRTKARRLQMDKKVSLIIVDYLQLVDPGKRYESRVQEVSVVSQSLKNLARELKIPVLAVSQLSRAVEHRGERKPQLADLRESGAIEQDADVVMFIYRPDAEVSPIMPT